MIRSILEYGSSVFQSMLTQRQREDLERVQKVAFKTIYSFDEDYQVLLGKAGVLDLETRREMLLLDFAKKTAANVKFNDWFKLQPRGPYEMRKKPRYVELFSRTERLYNSPLYNMRRILNHVPLYEK